MNFRTMNFTQRISAALFAGLVCLFNSVYAAPDFDRALSLPKRTENTVFRASFKANWLPDGKSFWYRVQTGPQSHEFVLINAETGERQTGRSSVR